MWVTTGLDVFLVTMTVVYIVLVLYMLRGWIQLRYFNPGHTAVHTPVSVLIAARNEEDNIARTLDCIVNQDFPKELLQIIVVADHSTDNTAAIVASYASRGLTVLPLNA